MERTSYIPGEGWQDQRLPSQLLKLGEDELSQRTRAILEELQGYKELIMMYTCAIKEVQTKFEVLSLEFNTRYDRNPITSIQTRLKSTASIAEKMIRKDLYFSLENVENNICDIAGVRVICSYVDDIYRLAEAFTQQDDVTLLERKDYIASPKPNGYRSLHLIVGVPVFFYNQRKVMKVEVQIRTIAMDFWASLEHELKYKQEVSSQLGIVEELKQCADTIARTDETMLGLRKKLDELQVEKGDRHVLVDKLLRLTDRLG